MRQIALRSDDADLAIRDLDSLGERAQVVAAIAAAGDPYALAGSRSERPYHDRRDRLLPGAFEDGGRPLRVGLRLIADRFQAGDAVLERGVVQIGQATFNGVVEPLES